MTSSQDMRDNERAYNLKLAGVPEHIRYTQAVISGEAIKHANEACEASHGMDKVLQDALDLAKRLEEQNKELLYDRDRLGHEVTRLNGEMSRRLNELRHEMQEQAITLGIVRQREVTERQAGARARALVRALAENTTRTRTGLLQIITVLQRTGAGDDAPSLVEMLTNLATAQGIALEWVERDLPADDDAAERN